MEIYQHPQEGLKISPWCMSGYCFSAVRPTKLKNFVKINSNTCSNGTIHEFNVRRESTGEFLVLEKR